MEQNPLFKEIEQTINDNNVVVFMKGTADFPQCGFSAAVAQIFQHLQVDFKDVNILEREGLRPALNEYANWPTSPKIYVKGEFIGGCDIIREMFETGELQDLLKEKGLLAA